jgi:hypothetical protein
VNADIEFVWTDDYRAALQSWIAGAGLKVEGDEEVSELEEAIAHLVTYRARR